MERLEPNLLQFSLTDIGNSGENSQRSGGCGVHKYFKLTAFAEELYMIKEQKKKGTMEDFIKNAGNSSLKIDKSMLNFSFVCSSSQSRETGQMFDSASAQEYH